MKNKQEYAHYIASLAQRAILYEVSTTPKPGLVDRYNSGAHKDMDFFTFMASSSVIYKGLFECALEGINFEDKEPFKLLGRLRPPGIECEREMFEVTNGVNTHKGIIFSLGILCAVVGRLCYRQKAEKLLIEDICEEVKVIAQNLVSSDFKCLDEKKHLTHGERLFAVYGFKGIRGEVEGGFKTVREKSVPILRNYKNNKDLSLNDLFLEMLLSIMTECEDTNVVIRGGIESLEYIKNVSNAFLQLGGMTQQNALVKLEAMNELFIEKNISPGGAADLLAVSIFLGMVEGIIK